jgi:hypothetical protein
MSNARKFTAAVVAILSEGLAAAGLGKVGAAERRATFYATIVAEQVTPAALVAIHNARTPDAPKKSNDSTVAAIVKSAQLWHDAGSDDAILPTASARYAIDRMAAKVTAARKQHGTGPEFGAAVAALVTAAKDEARTAARAAKGTTKATKATKATTAPTAPIVAEVSDPAALVRIAAETLARAASLMNEGTGGAIPADVDRALAAAATAYATARDARAAEIGKPRRK